MGNKINSNLKTLQTLPSPEELWETFPADERTGAFVASCREEIIRCLDPESDRRLLIVGPCSIHDLDAAREFAGRLLELAEEVKDTFLIIMRAYFEKPRTVLGWKGLLHDPHLDGSNDITSGLRLTRQLLLELACMGIPTGVEFLDPFSASYFSDLVAWGCVGARTSESQTHRQMASGLAMPIAFKNTTTGNIEIAIQGVLSSRTPHTFIGIAGNGSVSRVESAGNPHCHIALRGGEDGPNYCEKSIARAAELLAKYHLPQQLLVDCSHDNSRRQHERQVDVFEALIRQIADGDTAIRGMILESHLNSGNQPLNNTPSALRYAVSLTDPCLDWESTAALIRWGRESLKAAKTPAKRQALHV